MSAGLLRVVTAGEFLRMALGKVLAIDPGPRESGVVLWDHTDKRPLFADILPNDDMWRLTNPPAPGTEVPVVIEMVASYGMPVGREVFETVLWIGRFMEQAGGQALRDVTLLERRQVKLHLCDSSRAKDANVNQAVRDKVAAWHGLPERALKGRKASPGPLYGFKSHMWPALALAITWAETR